MMEDDSHQKAFNQDVTLQQGQEHVVTGQTHEVLLTRLSNAVKTSRQT